MNQTCLQHSKALEALLTQIRRCKQCADQLPLEPRPVLRAKTTARLLIAGQAPGRRVHETGIPWNDPSGDRLRLWLGLDRDVFYDDARIAIVPMGFCYPGRHIRGGDLPPRPECAATWMKQVLALLPYIDTVILAGAYAQQWHLGEQSRRTLTETVRHWRDYYPHYIPLPHPSFRNNHWLAGNPWFEEDLLPELRAHIEKILDV